LLIVHGESFGEFGLTNMDPYLEWESCCHAEMISLAQDAALKLHFCERYRLIRAGEIACGPWNMIKETWDVIEFLDQDIKWKFGA